MLRRRALGFASVLLFTAATVVAAARGSALPSEDAAEQAMIDAGRMVYEREKCATCHQVARRGNNRYPLDGVAARLTEDRLRRWLTHPAEMEAALPRMPALRMSVMNYRLKGRDLDALVAYLRTLK
jgi:mono/diheme cytochrome c family protein